ncbi:MAG TPA: nitroreductase family deazaflavin-dependent oxidoreductase [Oceanobacillus sp.]|nr:nitroreductase family deazaflavin-dependent oxidoreductase [Oceanobacillus sp.]
MTTTNTNHPPKGLRRLGFRIPVYFYRFGLGWLFGERLVLINHLGRKTGSPHQAVVEIVERDPQTGGVTIVAGYGEQTQWYKNLKAHPETTIQIGRHKMPVVAEFVAPEESEDIMSRYVNRHQKLTGELFSMVGYTWDGTEQGARQIARDSLRFVHFHPR